MRYHHRFLLLLLPCMQLGCERHERAREPELRPASRTVPAAETAAQQIAAARCDHEQRCNNVGANAKYASRQHCMNVMEPEARDYVGDCRIGIDQKDLRECVNSLESEECSAPLQRLAAIKECQTDNLCLSKSERDSSGYSR